MSKNWIDKEKEYLRERLEKRGYELKSFSYNDDNGRLYLRGQWRIVVEDELYKCKLGNLPYLYMKIDEDFRPPEKCECTKNEEFVKGLKYINYHKESCEWRIEYRVPWTKVFVRDGKVSYIQWR